MQRIILDYIDMAAALWFSGEVEKNLPPRPDYANLERPDRYLIGYLGEIAVTKLLRHHGVWFEHRVSTDGVSERPEITVQKNGTEKHVEVKTASNPRYQRFMFPKAQYDHDHSANLYIGTRIEWFNKQTGGGAIVSVMGWFTADDVKRLPIRDFGHGVPTIYSDFEGMRSPETLIRALDKMREQRLHPPSGYSPPQGGFLLQGNT